MKQGVKMSMWKIVVESVLLGLLMLAPMVQSSCFPAIFNFGDSTSDTGGIHASFPTSTPAEFSPYGETYFGKPNVRYSDGRLLIDFIGSCVAFVDLEMAHEHQLHQSRTLYWHESFSSTTAFVAGAILYCLARVFYQVYVAVD